MMVLGQANNKAKIEYWRMERFVLPEALGGDRLIRTEIRQLLSEAEDAQRSLWLACRSFARDVLGRGEREPDKNDVKKFVKQMTANSWYWSILESDFQEILREYTRERNAEDIRCQWLISVRSALKEAWEQHRNSVSMGDAWAIRAVVKAEGPIRTKLKELDEEIRKLTPAMEEA
jgi:CRISPR system Cascade subunit CasA